MATDTHEPRADWGKAVKEAAFWAVIALAVFGPIVGIDTFQQMDNTLGIRPRWSLLAIFVGGAAALRLLTEATRPLSHRALTALRRSFTPKATGPAVSGVMPVGYPSGRQATTIGSTARTQARSGGANPIADLIRYGGLLFLFVYPLIIYLIFGYTGMPKWIDNLGIQIMIYIMLAWGLNIVVGLAGLLDLGYVAFYAVGAYAYALLSTQVIPATYPVLGPWAFWICLPVAGLLAALWGVILGFPVLRLRGDYLAIVTLAFGEIIRIVLINWKEFSNGYEGISGIPRPSFFGIPFNASDMGFAAHFGLSYMPIYRSIFLYYVILVLALLTAAVTLRLRRLPIGRAWEALREDEIACRSLGINTVNTKLTAFAIGAMFGGFAGSFFAARQGFVSPESFTFMESAVILAIVVLGGMGSLVGTAFAAIVMIGGTELLRDLGFLKAVFGQDFDPALYRMLLFGLAMVVIMIWKPRGFVSNRTPTAFLKERKAISASHVKEGHG